MSKTVRVLKATPQEVWDVLSDGWLYATWVVGATRIRHVDDEWPKEGARIEHSVGVWPLVIDDHTEVTRSAPTATLELRAKAWPSGEADVRIVLAATDEGTQVTIHEDAAAGIGRLVPPPVRTVLLTWRNTETLRRLAHVAERRSSPTPAESRPSDGRHSPSEER